MINVVLLSWITFWLFTAALIWYFPLIKHQPLNNLLESIFSVENKPEKARTGTWKLKKDEDDGSAKLTIKVNPKDDNSGK